MSAVIQLKNSEKQSTQNSEPTNSPVASGDSPIGAKAVMAITVAPKRGARFATQHLSLLAVWFALANANKHSFCNHNCVIN